MPGIGLRALEIVLRRQQARLVQAAARGGATGCAATSKPGRPVRSQQRTVFRSFTRLRARRETTFPRRCETKRLDGANGALKSTAGAPVPAGGLTIFLTGRSYSLNNRGLTRNTGRESDA